MKGHFKAGSSKDDWSTPQPLFDVLNAEFHFDLDACATAETAKCATYFSLDKGTGALNVPWHGNVFMNPPYGRAIVQWVRKACEERRNANLIVGLLPARTDARWFHDYVLNQAHKVMFTRGRVGYLDPSTGVRAAANITFGSVIVVWLGFNHPAISERLWVCSFPLPKGSGRTQ